MAQDTEVLKRALAGLRRTTGLTAEFEARQPGNLKGPRADVVIELEVGGKRHQLYAEVKAVDRPVALAAAKHRLEAYGRKGVLVTPYLTTALARHCRESLDLQFIDTAGNA